MKTLLFLFLTIYVAFDEVNAFSADEIKFWVYAKENKDIKFTEFKMLEQLGFNKDLPTVFVVHGYLSGYAFIDEFEKAYKNDIQKTMNLIGIDWSAGAKNLLYPIAMGRTRLVGDTVGEFIMSSLTNKLINSPEDIHVTGHSLGAHIAGFVGKYMAKNGKTLQHITALDPAGVFIGSYACPDRLCDTDAYFVETIHSNGGGLGSLGMWNAINPLDMYLNGGSTQPQCTFPPCSHSYSHEWYRQSIHVDLIQGWKCNDLKQLEKEERCEVDGNPREYHFEIIQKQTPANLGITYVPTETNGRNADPVPRAKTLSKTKSEEKLPVVIFGFNTDHVNEFVSLLSYNDEDADNSDDDLRVELDVDKVTVTNPSDYSWQPDPKYVVYANSTDEIPAYLSKLDAPHNFVVPFDINEMFTEKLWKTLRDFAENQQSSLNTLTTVAMHIPHDDNSLENHLDDLQRRIYNGINNSADLSMLGMHLIKESGAVRDMPELVKEIKAIKIPVGIA